MVLCNNINTTDESWYDHLIQGADEPENCNEKEDGEWNISEIYQSYIITPHGARQLYNHTDEIIGYNPELDVFVWHITHWGTPWDSVYTTYDDDFDKHYFDLSAVIKHIN